jgi:hypothetical protein
LVLAATVGWRSGRNTADGPAELATVATVATRGVSPSPLASATPAARADVAVDWTSILDRLDAVRAAAFAFADAPRLGEVYAPGSPGLAADGAAIARLRADGLTARGVRHTFRRATRMTHDGRAARLRVTDVLAAYAVVARDGTVVSRAPARGERTYVVDLVRTADGWRMRQVTPA